MGINAARVSAIAEFKDQELNDYIESCKKRLDDYRIEREAASKNVIETAKESAKAKRAEIKGIKSGDVTECKELLEKLKIDLSEINPPTEADKTQEKCEFLLRKMLPAFNELWDLSLKNKIAFQSHRLTDVIQSILRDFAIYIILKHGLAQARNRGFQESRFRNGTEKVIAETTKQYKDERKEFHPNNLKALFKNAFEEAMDFVIANMVKNSLAASQPAAAATQPSPSPQQ